MIPAAIGQRYARALVDLAEGQGRLEVVASGLSQLAKLCEDHADLAAVMRHPGFSKAQRRAVFDGLLTALGSDDLIRPFLGLLIDKGRLPALSVIASAVAALTDQRLGRVRASALSAKPLTEAQLQALVKALKAKVGLDVVLHTEVDPRLLAGLQVQIGSTLYDGTVKGRLDRLGKRLLAHG